MRAMLIITAATVALAGCATTPRPFTPTVKPAGSSGLIAADAEALVNKCKVMVAEGRRSDFGGNAVSAGAGVAASTGFAASAGSALAYTSAATALTALTGVGVIAAFGVSRAMRSSNEREVKNAIEHCLREHGLAVTDWQVVKRR